MTMNYGTGFKTALALTLTLVAAAGCGPANLGLLSPTPKIKISAQAKTIALDIGPDVLDSYVIPPTDYTRPIQVSDWRRTLDAGFKTGFSPVMKVVDKDADLTVRLTKAEASFERSGQSASMASSSGSTFQVQTDYSIPVFTCRIVYKAQLVNPKGEVIQKASGVSLSTSKSSGIDELSTNAIENMYQQIAQRLFQEI